MPTTGTPKPALAKLTTSTTPATGTARTDEQVYDGSGRVVAKATSGDWICTSYDTRDRVTQVTFPANASTGARTVTTNYAVGGDSLTTSVADTAGTVTTTVDLLGRVVSYTDTHGTKTTTAYDQAGRVTSTATTPPNAADLPWTLAYTYDDAGRVLTTKLGTLTLATSSYDTAGELASVAYSNNASLAAIGKDTAGRVTTLTWQASGGQQTTSTVTRTRAGTIVDESLAGLDPNPAGNNYLYDAAGRLTEAYVTGHHYTYDFTSAAAGTCPVGTQANAGVNTNRVRLLDQTGAGTAVTNYCYDAADRLLAVQGASPVTGIQYDTHGNTTQFTADGTVNYLVFDTADRNVQASSNGVDPAKNATVFYGRDATDRIVRRDATSGDTQGTVLYGYTGSGDAADVTYDATKKLLTQSIGLPGGMLWTNTAGSGVATWDCPTVRGDLALTLNAAGLQAGDLRSYDPYGQPLKTDGTVDPQNVPDNSPGAMDYGWLGQHQRPYEHAGGLTLVQMGARPYSPLLGRFLAVDPIEGGSANDYDYANADPCNNTDLDGNASCGRKRKVSGVNGDLILNRRGGGRNKYGVPYVTYTVQIRLKATSGLTPYRAVGVAKGVDRQRSWKNVGKPATKLWRADSRNYGRPHSHRYVHGIIHAVVGSNLRAFGYVIGVGPNGRRSGFLGTITCTVR